MSLRCGETRVRDRSSLSFQEWVRTRGFIKIANKNSLSRRHAQIVEKEIDRSNATVAGDDEIGPCKRVACRERLRVKLIIADREGKRTRAWAAGRRTLFHVRRWFPPGQRQPPIRHAGHEGTRRSGQPRDGLYRDTTVRETMGICTPAHGISLTSSLRENYETSAYFP